MEPSLAHPAKRLMRRPLGRHDMARMEGNPYDRSNVSVSLETVPRGPR
jgi:hypothetical protein